MLRTGQGYDLHRLEQGRRLRLATVDVPSTSGAVGHSDGDALSHAVCDALFGALAAGDIGSHFPPEDERWAGVDSCFFLREAVQMLEGRGGIIINLDATVVIERPRLAPHIPHMRAALAEILHVDVDAVSVKAKTAEGLGAIGRGEAVEAYVVLLVRLPE